MSTRRSPRTPADYASEIVIAAGDIKPQIAAPHRVDNVSPVGEYEGLSLDQVCIGSCTNGRIEDMQIAAQVLKGQEGCCGDAARGVSCEQERALAGDLGGCNCNTC